MADAPMRRRVQQEQAYVLHSYAYRETSLVVEVFSRQHGRVALVARGARRPRSAMRGMLLAFHPLRLNWSAGAELGTLTGIEWSGGLAALAGDGLMCGFYLNELLLRLLPRDDPHERLFDAYHDGLALLAGGAPQAPLLRRFERRLLAELGYAPVLERDAASGAPIDPLRRYRYEADRGPVPLNGGGPRGTGGGAEDEDGSIEGRTLLDIANEDYARPQTRDEARRLMRTLIAQRLGGQALHTRAMLKELQDL